MSDTTDIEKKSLEAHVELCAERYRFIEEKLETVESKIAELKISIANIHDMLTTVNNKHQNQILKYSGGLIGILIAIVGYLLTTYVFK